MQPAKNLPITLEFLLSRLWSHTSGNKTTRTYNCKIILTMWWGDWRPLSSKVPWLHVDIKVDCLCILCTCQSKKHSTALASTIKVVLQFHCTVKHLKENLDLYWFLYRYGFLTQESPFCLCSLWPLLPSVWKVFLVSYPLWESNRTWTQRISLHQNLAWQRAFYSED